jgi:hypothetical protein
MKVHYILLSALSFCLQAALAIECRCGGRIQEFNVTFSDGAALDSLYFKWMRPGCISMGRMQSLVCSDGAPYGQRSYYVNKEKEGIKVGQAEDFDYFQAYWAGDNPKQSAKDQELKWQVSSVDINTKNRTFNSISWKVKSYDEE